MAASTPRQGASMSTPQQYTAGANIEPAGDPWLQRPDGTVVPIVEHLLRLPVGECEECRGGFFAPTITGPTDQGVERCDECSIYEGDFDAALALAGHIGPEITVWFEPDTEDDEEGTP